MLKARPQAGMAFNQNLGCPFQSRPVERPLQCQRQLHDVDVRRTHIVKRMEQQPLLQGLLRLRRGGSSHGPFSPAAKAT